MFLVPHPSRLFSCMAFSSYNRIFTEISEDKTFYYHLCKVILTHITALARSITVGGAPAATKGSLPPFSLFENYARVCMQNLYPDK